MEELTNITDNFGDLGAIAENLNPLEELGAQAEEAVGGIGDSIGGVADSAQGAADDILGGFQLAKNINSIFNNPYA